MGLPYTLPFDLTESNTVAAPAARTLAVTLDNRVLVPAADNRVLVPAADDRVLVVKA